MTPDFMREGEEPEMQTFDLPDIGSSPRNLEQSPAPKQVVPTPDSGEGTTPTGTMASLREQFPAPKTNIDYAGLQAAIEGKKRASPEPDYLDRGYSDTDRIVDPWSDDAPFSSYAPPRIDKDIYMATYERTGREVAERNAAEKQDAADRQAISLSSLPIPEKPQVSEPASGSMGSPSVPAASKVPATPGSPDPTAIPTPGATTSPKVMSQYDALKKAFEGGGGDEPDYSGVVRGAEDVYAALTGKKADYRVADEMAAARKARAEAPLRKFAQAQMLEQVRQTEEPLPDSYLDQLGAPHGLNKAQLKDFLDRRETVATIKQKERGPAMSAEALQFADWRDKNPNAPISEYEAQKRQVQAAQIRGESAKRINDLKDRTARLKIEEEKAEGQKKRDLQMRIAELEAATRKEIAVENRKAAEERAIQSDVTKLAAKQTPLAQTYSAFEEFKNEFPDALTGSMTGENLNWLERLAASNPMGLPTRALLGEDKQRLDRMQQNFLDIVKRARTGASANSLEDRTYARILGTDFSSDPNAFADAIQDFAAAFQTQLRSAEHGVRPEAVRRYTSGGGVPSSEASVFAPARAAAPAPVGEKGFKKPPAGKVYIYEMENGSPNGKYYTYDADDEDVSRAEEDPDVKVVR